MASDFTIQGRLAARYRFESGALGTDEQGQNNLTPYNSPGESTGDYQEGACALDLEASSSQYLRRDDADLSANFPFKSGTPNNRMTVCLWFKPESFSAYGYILSKWLAQGNNRQWGIYLDSTGALKFQSSQDGTSTYSYSYTIFNGLQTGRWYHLGLAYSAVDKYVRAVLYDATAGTESINKVYDSYPVCFKTAPFLVGCIIDTSGNPAYFYDGLMDELLVFNGLLPYDELRAIRKQTFPAEVRVSRWQFEDGPGFLNDSIGSHTLTNYNGVTQDESIYHEGAASAAFVAASSQSLKLPEASQSADFPVKSGSGDTARTISLFARVRPSGTADKTIFSKYDIANNKRFFRVGYYGNNWRIYSGYNNGASNEYADLIGNTPFDGEWIAVCLTIDLLEKYYTLRIYRYSDSNFYYLRWSPTNAPSVTDVDFVIGGQADNAAVFWNGNIDDVQVFGRVITNQEFLRLARGLYDGLNSRQTVVNTALVVAYKEPEPGQFTHEGDITVTVDPTSGPGGPVYAHQGNITAEAIVEGAHVFQGANEFVHAGNIPVTALPSAVSINVKVHQGNIVVTAIPQGTHVNCVFQHFGNIDVEVTPCSVYRMPVPGWDIPSGYGCVDFSALADPPPYWCIETEGLALALDNTAAKLELYAESSLETQGGVAVGGALALEVVEPGISTFDISGGVKVGGDLEIECPEPWITTHETQGGVAVGGALEITEVKLSTSLITEITTSRGVAVGGGLGFSFVEPADLVTAITLSGGVVVGYRRYPPIEFINPDMEEIYYEFTTRGTVYVGGELDIEAPEPEAYEWTSRRGGVVVGGDCAFGFWQPPITEFDLMGGVFVEGSIIEDSTRFETWALTGLNFSPSMYSGFNFNSYAARNGQILAAREDGIYVLEGDDDAGQPIHPGVRLGPHNLGIDREKRLRAVRLEGNDEATVKVTTGGGKEGFFEVDRGKVAVSRDLQDREFTLDIADFERLSHLEIVPLVLAKR